MKDISILYLPNQFHATVATDCAAVRWNPSCVRKIKSVTLLTKKVSVLSCFFSILKMFIVFIYALLFYFTNRIIIFDMINSFITAASRHATDNHLFLKCSFQLQRI